MSLSADTIEFLLSKGLSGDDLLQLARLQEGAGKSSAAIRQQRYRDAQRNARDVTRDVTDSPSLDKEKSPKPPKEINPIRDIYTPLTPQGGRSPQLDFLILDLVCAAILAGCEHVAENTITPEHVVEAYNSIADQCGLPKAKLTPERRRKLTARIKQHAIADFTEAIDALARNPWLHGENDRGWRADFDFLLQPKSFTRLIEGGYDRAH